MIYLDTNVLIALIDERDPNHERAEKLPKDERVTSKLAMVDRFGI